jgi:hypothetical protein
MLVDPNFDIGAQALAVMSYFNSHDGIEPSWENGRYRAEVKAAPWYNGRERGIVFYMRTASYKNQLNIAVYEHRNTDTICALRWQGNTFNPPTLADIPAGTYQDKWDTAKDFGYGQAQEMAQWLYNEFCNYWQEHSKKSVDTATV